MYRQPASQLRKYAMSEPYGTTQGPDYRNQREASRHICLVCELRQHTLDHAYVSIKHAI
jgi:hypothetical protein